MILFFKASYTHNQTFASLSICKWTSRKYVCKRVERLSVHPHMISMEVIHITCSMCSHGLPDMYAFSPWACSPWALGIHVHIRQIPYDYATTITCVFLHKPKIPQF